VRPPRRLHDTLFAVEREVDDLTQELGRPPSTAEVAARLGVAVEEVVEARGAAGGRRPVSMDAPSVQGWSLGESLGGEDGRLAATDDAVVLAGLLGRLPEREARAVRMRFEWDMTQDDIARELGCSQMQVSRILARALGRLRALAGPDSPPH
jgi:RNA polymerase sigma-B factor